MYQQKMLFLVLPLLLLCTMLQAQAGRGMNMEPSELAQRQTDDMTEQLALSDAQKAKVQEVNLLYANKMKEAREAADGDWTAMRETMGAIRSEKNEALKKYLTTEQFEKWQTIQKERMSQRRDRREKRPKEGDKSSGQN